MKLEEMSANGGTRPKAPVNYIERNQAIVEMRNSGQTLQSIADHFNIALSRVWYILRRETARTK